MTDLWEYLSEARLPILVYGTGNGADKILNILEEKAISVSDIFTSDDFFREKSFRGFKLKSFSEISEKYERAIIILAFAVFRPEMLKFIKELNKRYELLSPSVSVFGSEYFSAASLEKYAKELKLLRELLCDEKSKQVLEKLISYRLSGRLEPLFEAESERSEIFENIIKLSDNERFLDLGAYDGDSISEFIKLSSGSFDEIIAFEPDKRSFLKLEKFKAELSRRKALQKDGSEEKGPESSLEECNRESSREEGGPEGSSEEGSFEEGKAEEGKIRLYNYAAWSSRKKLNFKGGEGRNSSVGEGKYAVNAIDIDSFLLSNGLRPPTYVKLDVEGSEREALIGMRKLLCEEKPKLSVAAYHKTGDLFTLPLLIKELNPEYKIFLRHTPYIPDWETNLYCI